MAKKSAVTNCVVISDTHFGDQLSLCPESMHLRHGGTYRASKFQNFIREKWEYFWDTWVPQATRGEPYCVVLNGDAMEGRHHRATHPISQDMSDQEAVAYEMLAPVDKDRRPLPEDAVFTAVTDIKYDGYIKKQLAEARKFEKLEKRKFPAGTDFRKIRGISTEASQKLDRAKPASIGEASRISGVSPADIAVLLIYLDSLSSDRKRKNKTEE